MTQRLAPALLQRTKTLLAGAAIFAATTLSAHALEPIPDEAEKLKACEKNLCTMIITKDAAGDDLSCAISKTWAKEKISKGAESKSIDWGFGDARCTLDISVPRKSVVSSLTEASFDLEVPEQTVKCEIERGEEVTPINVSLAPKLTFKDGKAHKAWLNIGTIEAPAVVKGAIWTAAKLEDNFGLFHSDIIDEVNDFVHNECAKRYPDVTAAK
ncbi:MAG: hypothetical protein AAFR75_07120 [Pseudomonadota bacterium]